MSTPASTASANNNVLINELFNARTYVLELMQEQGYDVSKYTGFSIREINALFLHDRLDMLLEHPQSRRKMYIRFYLAKTLRHNHLAEMIDDLFDFSKTLSKEDTLFIVTKDEINDTLHNELRQVWEKDKVFIVAESLARLQFNILKHELVPPHQIMNDADVLAMMQKYNLSDKSQLPDISRFDPVAKAICIRPGQVCRILRPSKTAIFAPFYRVCV